MKPGKSKKKLILIVVAYALCLAALLSTLLITGAKYASTINGHTYFNIGEFRAVLLDGYNTANTHVTLEELSANERTQSFGQFILPDCYPGMEPVGRNFVVANGRNAATYATMDIQFTVKVRSTGNLPLRYELTDLGEDLEDDADDKTLVPSPEPQLITSAQDGAGEDNIIWHEYSFYETANAENEAEFMLHGVSFDFSRLHLSITWPMPDTEEISVPEMETVTDAAHASAGSGAQTETSAPETGSPESETEGSGGDHGSGSESETVASNSAVYMKEVEVVEVLVTLTSLNRSADETYGPDSNNPIPVDPYGEGEIIADRWHMDHAYSNGVNTVYTYAYPVDYRAFETSQLGSLYTFYVNNGNRLISYDESEIRLARQTMPFLHYMLQIKTPYTTQTETVRYRLVETDPLDPAKTVTYGAVKTEYRKYDMQFGSPTFGLYDVFDSKEDAEEYLNSEEYSLRYQVFRVDTLGMISTSLSEGGEPASVSAPAVWRLTNRRSAGTDYTQYSENKHYLRLVDENGKAISEATLGSLQSELMQMEILVTAMGSNLQTGVKIPEYLTWQEVDSEGNPLDSEGGDTP